MRTYTENWNYSLTTSSSPYARNNGSPSFSNNHYIAPYNCFINKDTVGQLQFGGNNYSGSYALKFTLNADSAAYIGFMSLVYGVNSYVPTLYCYNGSGIYLGWSYYSTRFNAACPGQPAATGDFNNRYVAGSGDFTVIVLKKMATVSTQSYVAMHIVSPAGAHFKTGWALVNDTYLHNQLGCNQGIYGSGYVSVGPMTVVDQLSDSEIDSVLATGSMVFTPTPTITPASSQQAGPATVTINPPTVLPAGWTLKYTTDGSDPSGVGGILYTGPFVVGSPYTPGTSVTVSAVYTNDNYPTTSPAAGTVVSATYSFVVLAPISTQHDWQYAQDDIVLNWTNAPTDSSIQFIYTMDGSDPVTSPTAKVWVSGDIFPFNAYPPDLTPANMQTNVLRAIAKHVASGAHSTETLVRIAFYLGWGTPAQPASGHISNDVTFSWPRPIANPTINFVTDVAINGVTTRHTGGSGTVVIPMQPTPVTVAARVSTADGSLYLDYADPQTGGALFTYSFMQQPPTLDRSVAITSTTTVVSAVNPNGSQSTMYYTVDGSTPTVSSSVYTGPVTLAPKQVLKMFATRQGVASSMVALDVLGEYEVTEVANTTEDANYHYYVAEQRMALTSDLGVGPEVVTVGSNTTPTPVTVTVDGTDYPISAWDSANPGGAYNLFKEFLWMPNSTKFWSRLSYSAATMAFSWNYVAPIFAGVPPLTLLTLSVVSQKYQVVFRYVINPANETATIYRKRLDIGSGESAETSVVGTVLGTAQPVLTLSIVAGSITLTDGTGTSTETNAGFTSGTVWHVEGVVNPDGVLTPYIAQMGGSSQPVGVGIGCTITTTAVSGRLRRAPGSVVCSTNVVSHAETVAIDFSKPDGASKVKIAKLSTGYSSISMAAPVRAGYSSIAGLTRLEGPFDLRFPYVLDTTQDFDAEIDLTTDFNALMTGSAFSGGSNPLPSVTFALLPTGTQIDETSVGSTFITCRLAITPSTSDRAKATTLELFADSTQARIALSSATRRLHLRMSGRSSGITMSAVIDGVATTVAVIPQLSGNGEFSVKRSGATDQPRRQVTELIGFTCTGTFQKKVCSNPVLVGANFILRGVATGFDSVPLTVAANVQRAVYFDPATQSIAVEALGFEATDGRLLVGVIETPDGNVLWTNTMYSKLVKVHKEANGSFISGGVISVGSNLRIADHRAYWTNAGTSKSAAVGDLNWVTPSNHLDLRLGKHVVHAYERQRINISASKTAS